MVVDVKNERVWGWDYLQPLCAALDLDPVRCGVFPAGCGAGPGILDVGALATSLKRFFGH